MNKAITKSLSIVLPYAIISLFLNFLIGQELWRIEDTALMLGVFAGALTAFDMKEAK